jgi:ABC-type transport system involved in cytochrome bd biosynthesis fused ATPase/permease subunit
VETGIYSKDELIKAIQKELEETFAEDTNSNNKANPSEMPATDEHERQKKMIMKVLAASAHTQRLYFVIRSAIMSLISASIFFVAILYLGTINVIQAILLGLLLFVASLVLSRLLDKQIIALSKHILNYLNKHKKARTYVLKKL